MEGKTMTRKTRNLLRASLIVNTLLAVAMITMLVWVQK